MSVKRKFNVKNVILGCHNFSNILSTHNSSFSRLYLVPRATPLCRPGCAFYKQACLNRSTLNHGEAPYPRNFENLMLKRVSSVKPVTSKWLNEVRTRAICTPGCGLPWESSYSFCYDQKNPKCTVKQKYLPYPPCPSMLLCNPYKELIKSDPFADTQCTLNTVPLNICRFYSANPDPPSRGRKTCKCSPCRPCRPLPKCKPKFCVPRPKRGSQRKCCPPNANQCGKKTSYPKPPKPKCPEPKCSKPK